MNLVNIKTQGFLTFFVGVIVMVGLGGDLEVVDIGDLSLSSKGGVAGGVGRSSSSSSRASTASLEAVCKASSMETSVDLLLESSMLSNEVLRLISKLPLTHLSDSFV